MPRWTKTESDKTHNPQIILSAGCALLGKLFADHSEMPQRLFNGLFLLWRALWHPTAFILRLVVILPFNQPVLPLHLSNIQHRYLQSCMLQHIILNLRIGGIVQQAGCVQVIQRELHPNRFAFDFSLGKLNNRLVGRPIVTFPENPVKDSRCRGGWAFASGSAPRNRQGA